LVQPNKKVTVNKGGRPEGQKNKENHSAGRISNKKTAEKSAAADAKQLKLSFVRTATVCFVSD